MTQSAPEIIYGAGNFGWASPGEQKETLSILRKHHVKSIDTAYIYPDSEVALSKHDAPKNFVIHTKAPSMGQPLKKQNILDAIDKSLKDLNIDSIDLYYLHGPDPTTPIEETMSTIQEVYAAGKFKCFGLSNFMPDEVQKVYEIQSTAKSVLPTVFQGNYNAVSRHIEDDLFPVLRKFRISFYAYSPIAGGFLVKTPDQLRSREVKGRFSGTGPAGTMYNDLYGAKSLLSALDDWDVIATDGGITKAALAYRWITYHSALRKGDGVIIGARNVQQLDETLTDIEEGPLDESIAERASDIWEKVKADAPRDVWHDYIVPKLQGAAPDLKSWSSMKDVQRDINN